MDQSAYILPLISVAAVVCIALIWRSFWLIPIGTMVLLPAIGTTFAAINVGSLNFNFTALDVSFWICAGALVLRRRAVLQEKAEIHPALWQAAWSGVFLIIILILINLIANRIHQSALHSLWSTLRLFRTYCQALVLPVFVLIFLRGRALNALTAFLFLFAALELAVVQLTPTAFNERAAAFDMSPNAAGQALSLVIICALVHLMGPGNKLIKVTSFLAVITASLGMFATGSREALIGTIVGILYLVSTNISRHRSISQLLYLSVMAVSMIVSYYVTQRFNSGFANVFMRMQTVRPGESVHSDPNLSARLILAGEAVSMYAKSPLLLVTGRGIPGGEDTNWVSEDADSAYIDTANALGIFGLFFILLYQIRFWRLAKLFGQACSCGYLWANGVQATLLTYWIMGLAANVFSSPHTTILFLIVISIGMANLGVIEGRK